MKTKARQMLQLRNHARGKAPFSTTCRAAKAMTDGMSKDQRREMKQALKK